MWVQLDLQAALFQTPPTRAGLHDLDFFGLRAPDPQVWPPHSVMWIRSSCPREVLTPTVASAHRVLAAHCQPSCRAQGRGGQEEKALLGGQDGNLPNTSNGPQVGVKSVTLKSEAYYFPKKVKAEIFK